MRHLLRTEVALVVTFAAAMLAAYIGLAIFVSGDHQLLGFVILLGGGWMMIYAPVLHDRAHRERGEATHAVWGRDDRRKPQWWDNWRTG